MPTAEPRRVAGIFAAMGYRAMALPKRSRGEPLLEGAVIGPDERVCLYGHRRYDRATGACLDGSEFRTLVVLRDPRDICLAMADRLRAAQVAGGDAAAPHLGSMTLDDIRRQVIVGFDLPGYRTQPILRMCEGWKEWQRQGAVIVKAEAIAQSIRSGLLMHEIAALGVDPRGFLGAARRRFQPIGRPDGASRWRCEFDAGLRALWREQAGGVAAALGYDED